MGVIGKRGGISKASMDSTAGQSNGGDWREEVYQKIKVMKEMYLPELNEMHQKIATKLQQHDSLPQQPKSEQLEKLKMFRSLLEPYIGLLQVSKMNVQPSYKEKLGSYEKQIVNFINTNRPRNPSMQQGQLPPPDMHSMQQPSQVQSLANQMNPQMQSMNLQGSVATTQPNNMTSLQHNAISSISGAEAKSGSNLDSGQGNTLNSLQQVAVGSLPQNSVTASQQANINTPSKAKQRRGTPTEPNRGRETTQNKPKRQKLHTAAPENSKTKQEQQEHQKQAAEPPAPQKTAEQNSSKKRQRSRTKNETSSNQNSKHCGGRERT